MLDRTDKSIIGIWWWTVDKWILTSALLLIIIGGILIMAASPPVANAIKLPEDHFVWKQLIFSIPASFTIIFLSFLKNYQIRLISFLGLIVTFILDVLYIGALSSCVINNFILILFREISPLSLISVE